MQFILETSPSVIAGSLDKNNITGLRTSAGDIQELTGLKENMSTDQMNLAIKSAVDPGPSTASPSAYFSPKEVRPLPTAHVPLGTRKRMINKSEVLISTPVKEEQKVKFVKVNTKVKEDKKIKY